VSGRCSITREGSLGRASGASDDLAVVLMHDRERNGGGDRRDKPVADSGHGFDVDRLSPTGAVEVGAGAALLMPGARRLASAVLLVVMAGAIYTHVLHGESRRALLPVVLSAPLVWFSARRGDSFHGRVRST